MRSRFSAYVLDLPKYIIQTTHPASPQYIDNHQLWEKRIYDFSKNSSFGKLEVLEFIELDTYAKVIFVAHLTQHDKDATFTEKSHFEKIQGTWFYKYGQLMEGREPNLITTGQIRPLPISYYGDEILRKKAEPISEITPSILKLVEEMEETMDASNGIGLAAPQVHHSIRLFIIREPVYDDQGNMEFGKVKAFINPKLSNPSSETWTAAEGCLSIPTIHADVTRPKEIDVEYLDLQGNTIKKRFSGWEARELMHENDHLNGVLFIDRMSDDDKTKLKSLLDNLRKRIHDGTEL